MSRLKNTFIFRFIAVILSVMILFTTYSSTIISISAVSTENETVGNDSDYTIKFLTDSNEDVCLYYWEDGGDGKFYNGTPKLSSAVKDGKTLYLWEYTITSSADNCIFTTSDNWGSAVKLSGDLSIPDINTSANQFYYEAIGSFPLDNSSLSVYNDLTISFTGGLSGVEGGVGETIHVANFSDFEITGTMAPYITSYRFYKDDSQSPIYEINADNTAFMYTPDTRGVHTIPVKAVDIFGYEHFGDTTFTVIAREKREGFTFANKDVYVTYGTDECNNLEVQSLTTSYDNVIYESSDTSVAEIYDNNKINIKKAGTDVSVTITASAEQTNEYYIASNSYTLHINSGNFDSVSFAVQGTYNHTYDENNNKFKNELKNLPSGATVQYSSSNSDIASVDKNSGEVTVHSADAGVTIFAEITAENYSDKTIYYTLYISNGNIDVENISETITYSEGLTYECDINKQLPTGGVVTFEIVSQSYEGVAEFVNPDDNTCNTLKINRSGEFQVKATIEAPNYETKEINIDVEVKRGDYSDDKGFSFSDDFKNGYTFTYGVDGNNIQLNLDKEYQEGLLEYASSDNSVATISDTGLISVHKASGEEGITISVKRPEDDWYEDETATFTLVIEKGERPGWEYSESKAIYYGQSLVVETPTEIDLTKVSFSSNDTSNIIFDGNKLTPKAIGSYIIKVTAEEDDCYNAKTAYFDLDVNYLSSDEWYTLEGNRVNSESEQFNSDVIVKANAGYKIALYDENCDYSEYTSWSESVSLDSNIENPEFVCVSVADNDTKGAISDVITSGITIDKIAPFGKINVDTYTFTELLTEILDAITFGILNIDKCNINIIAEDNSTDLFNSEKKIEYYVDEFNTSEEMVILSESDLEQSEILWTEYSEPFVLNDGYSIVYARLSDEYGNKRFISTNSTVVDTQNPNVKSAVIETAKNDFGYYNSDLVLKVETEDSGFSSGISSVEYKLYDKNGKEIYNGSFTDGDSVTIPYDEIIGENVSYKIFVTDCVGNCGKYESEKFNVSEAPEISLILNSSAFNEYSDDEYYSKDNVEISLVINQDDYVFDETAADVLFEDIFADYSDCIEVSEWITDSENTNVHTKTVKTNTDGLYKFSEFINSEKYTYHNAKISSNDEVIYDFIIDTTAPTAIIKYDNNNSADGYYYQANRVATITVDDANFEGKADMISIVAKDVTNKELTEGPQVVWNGNVGTVTFTDDTHYSIKVTDKFKDKATNDLSARVVDQFAIDKVNPENLEIEYKSEKDSIFGTLKDLAEKLTGGLLYFSDDIKVTVSATDITSGIDRIEYSAPLLEGSTEVGTTGVDQKKDYNTDENAVAFSTTFTVPAEYKGTIKAVAYDRAGRSTESAEANSIVVSNKKPEITLEVLNFADAVIHDGISYYNEDIKIKATVEDVFFDNSKVLITETTDGNSVVVKAESWTRVENTNKYETTVTISSEGVKTLDVSYTNNSGNSADSKYVDNIVVDKTPTKATLKFDNNTSDIGGYYYQANRVATIAVDDVNFSGEANMICITATDVTATHLTSVPNIVWEGKVGTIKFIDDAHYTISVGSGFVDMAGNPIEITVDESTKDAYEFAIDKVDPENLKIEYKSGKDSIFGTLKDLAEKLTGGLLYFSDDIKVTVSATDITSGIDRIEYSAPLLEGSTEVGTTGVENTTVKNSNGTSESFSTTFTVPAEYKGTIEAVAYDRAGRSTESAEANSIVVSNKKPEITLEVLNPTDAVIHDGISYYNEDVKIKATVEDVFFDNSKVLITETTDGNSVVAKAESWTRVENTNKYETTVTISSEGVKTLDVSYTNNSGISADSKYVDNIVVDKTAPKVTISYDNNTSNVNGYYYQANRVSTITVDDVNFTGKTEMVDVTAKDVANNGLVSVPEIIWNSKVGKISFAEDAHYTLTIKEEFVDLAGNFAEITVDESTKDAYEFAIDKVDPENLKIEYKSEKDSIFGTLKDLAEKLTGGLLYFSDDIKVTVSATDITSGIDRIEYSAPLLEGSAEVGTAGVDQKKDYNTDENAVAFSTTFIVPAEYKGTIEAVAYDRAGRSTASAEANSIVVSNKKPEITLEVLNPTDAVIHDGISYYNEDIKIKVTVEDVFFYSSKVLITETTDGNSVVVKAESWTRVENTNKYETTVTISSEGVKTLDVSYTNNSGNSADSKYVDNIVVDKTAPKVTISYDNNTSLVNGYYYQANRVSTITVDDVNFTGKTEMVNVTAKDVANNGLVSVPEIIWNGKVGKISFAEDAHYTLTIKEEFVDLAGNFAEITVDESTKDAYEFAIDKVDPENLKIEYKSEKDSIFGTLKDLAEKLTGGLLYFSDDIKVTVSATDITSGIDRIEYSAPLLEGSTEVGTTGVENTTVKNSNGTSESFSTTFIVPAEYKGTIEAVAYDRAGRSTASAEANSIVVSNKKPEITLEVLNPTDAVIHDGISYYNEDVKIKATVEDVFFDNSKVLITETTDGNSVVVKAESWTRVENTNKYETTVTISSEGVKTLDVSYTNNSGNSADSKYVDNIVVDKTAPKVTISYDNNTSLVNGYYYNKARTATITVDDVNFRGEIDMVKTTAIDKSGKAIEEIPEIGWAGKVGTIVFTEDAYYTLQITDKYVDKAGTKAEVSVESGTKDAYSFVVDKSNPDVGTISVKDQNSKVIDLSNKEQSHTELVFSNTTVDVSITANDVLTNTNIEYYISSSYLECKNIDEWEVYTGSIELGPDRKFVLYTKITDQAGNYIYRTTNIIILDKSAPDIDGISPDIKLNPSSNTQKVDKNGDVLYNGDVKVDYVITDPIINNSCAGLDLEKLTYKVICDGKITQSGTLSGTVTDFDNRVGAYKGTVTVDSKLNNSNNVQLVVDATDNALNHSSKTANLKIDITSPAIDVYWDKSSDSVHTTYFNETRTATITIKERNFDADDVVVTMTKDGAEYNPSFSFTHSGIAGTDEYLHTAEINIASDGDYTFDISYVDEATNKAGEADYGSSVAPREFTVDLIRPEINVVFDNNSAQNENYYNEHRTATITVNEHNFDASRFEYSCTATDDGVTVTAPVLGSWTSSGDMHTAIVNFTADAKFTLEVSGRDMANNEVEASQRFEFYVDTTAPEISISGINYQSANNGKDGDIGFTITATDTNINTSTFSPDFRRVDIKGNNESVISLGNKLNINNGVTYTVNNIKDDGIYTVSCEVVDMAGNVTSKSFVEGEDGKKYEEQETLFSVNREGSTFMLDENSQRVVDLGYIQNVENDVIITEINPDRVGKYVVTLEKDSGKAKVLSIGENYTRKEDDSTGTWKTYTYTVKANNFVDEASYNLAVTTTDTAENTSYSETKNPSYTQIPLAKVSFVVDRTIPEVVVTNIESNAHYNVDKQSVNIIANDDNLLNSVKIVLNNEVIKEYNEEELVKSNGKMSLDINSLQSLQNLEIIAVDAAGNSTSDSDETEVMFTNFLVTTNIWIQFINNPIAVIISLSGLLLLTALIIFIIVKRKSKKDEEDE